MSQYIHHIPGRIRVRSNAFRCSAHRSEAAREHLLSMDGVEAVQINPRAGSITVNYDPARLTHPELLGTLERLGCMGTVRRTTNNGARRAGELFGKALVTAMVQKAVEHSARSLVGALI
ncbi:MAG: cation transporter [Chromatiaceae bacterium]|nr:MAG: cation transporter [Chromatiaceae bacterium]